MRSKRCSLLVGAELVQNQRGQAMSEYLIIVILVSLVLIPYARLLPQAIQGYVRPFYYCVSRPFP